MSSHVHVDEETWTPKAFNIQFKNTSTTVSYIYFITLYQTYNKNALINSIMDILLVGFFYQKH